MGTRFARRLHRGAGHRGHAVNRRFRFSLDPGLEARCREELAIIVDHRAFEG